MKRTFWPIIMTAVLMALAGCSDDDCPTCPPTVTENPPYDGRLYASTWLGTQAIFVIDTKTDSVVDSVILGFDFRSLDVSEKGELLAASDVSGTRIVDALTLQELVAVPSLFRPTFVNQDQYLLGSTTESYELYDLTDYSLIWSRDVSTWAPYRYAPKTNSFFGLVGSDTLFRMQINSSAITDQWVIRTSDGREAHVYDFDISEDGSRFYGLVANSLFARYVEYNLSSDSLISEFTLVGSFGAVREHPDRNEVWVTDPANGGLDPVYPGTIYIFDALTGEYLRGISLYGYVPWPQVGLDAWKLEFTPDGSHAYVLTGNYSDPPTGNILRIDTRSYRVENLIFPEFDHYFSSLAVGPKP